VTKLKHLQRKTTIVYFGGRSDAEIFFNCKSFKGEKLSNLLILDESMLAMTASILSS
jgi:hypothetical protein